jgi:hypothetical protein
MPQFFNEKFFKPVKEKQIDYISLVEDLYQSIPPINFISWYQNNAIQDTPSVALEKFIESAEFEVFKAQVNALVTWLSKWCQEKGEMAAKEVEQWKLFGENILNSDYIRPETQLDMYGRGKIILETLYIELTQNTENFDKQKRLLATLIKEGQLSVCAPGIFTNLENIHEQLQGDLFASSKKDIANQLALEFIKDKRLCLHKGNEIHYVNALLNYVANSMGITFVNDIHATQDIEPSLLEDFKNKITEKIDSPFLLNIVVFILKEKFINVNNEQQYDALINYLDSLEKDEGFCEEFFYNRNESQIFHLKNDDKLDFKIRHTLLQRLINSENLSETAFKRTTVTIQEECTETINILSKVPKRDEQGKFYFPIENREIKHPKIELEILFIPALDLYTVQEKAGISCKEPQALISYLNSDAPNKNKQLLFNKIIEVLNPNERVFFIVEIQHRAKAFANDILSNLNGEDFYACNSKGQSLIDVAVLQKYYKLLKYLLDNPTIDWARAGHNRLHIAAMIGDQRRLSKILTVEPGLLNVEDQFNQTPLIWAAFNMGCKPRTFCSCRLAT